jgi:hypothetical protein
MAASSAAGVMSVLRLVMLPSGNDEYGGKLLASKILSISYDPLTG